MAYDPITGILQNSRQFRMLAIGNSFDFIKPDSLYNSFFLRCTKTGPRKYQDQTGANHRIGSIKAQVYNVLSHAPQHDADAMARAHRAGCDYARRLDASAHGAQLIANGLGNADDSMAFIAGYRMTLRRMVDAGKPAHAAE